MADALKELANAEKALRKPWYAVKWTPDYDEAASHYERAAQIFRSKSASADAIKAFAKAGESYEHTETPSSAGKSFETAGQLAQHSGNKGDAITFFERASRAYLMGGYTGKGSECLHKAAKIDGGEKLLWQLADMYRDENKKFDLVEVLGQIVRQTLRKGEVETAIKASSEILQVSSDRGLSYQRSVLNMVAMHLKQNDIVAADKVLQRYGRDEGDYSAVAGTMIQAFQDFDQEQFEKATKHHVVRLLDPEVSKFIMALKAPGGGSKSTQSTTTPGASGAVPSHQSGPSRVEPGLIDDDTDFL